MDSPVEGRFTEADLAFVTGFANLLGVALNDRGQNALEVVDQKVGWHRLLRMKPELAAMVEENEASPLVLAAEQHSGVIKYATAFLATFRFRSARRHDSLLTAIAML